MIGIIASMDEELYLIKKEMKDLKKKSKLQNQLKII